MLQKLKRVISAAVAGAVLVCALPLHSFADGINKADYEELTDGYIKVDVSAKNGGFLIDTVEGDKLNKADDNKYLLFPDENYDTSYTSFRVKRGDDVKDYIFGRKYGFLGMNSSGVTLVKNEDSISAEWSVDGLTFTQTITLANTKSPLHGMAAISYGVKSTDGRAVDDVKARIMLDTALGYQDYAVYELTQKDSTYKQVQQEILVDNADGKAYNNALFGYDNPKSPTITAYTVNASVNNTIIAPYQLAFGHWNNLASTVFDFTPDTSLTFTNQYNEKYLTADSAYALYFDMGSVSADGKENVIATNYGVYSNATVNNADKVSINFSSELSAMQLNDAKDAYKSQNDGGKDGDFSVSAQIKNVSSSEIKQVAVAIYPQEGITPYGLSGKLETMATYVKPYSVEIVNMNAGEERQVKFNLNAEPLNATDYRKIELRCFDVSGTNGELLSENLLGSRSIYLLCPGATGDRVSFLSTAPEVIYNSGTRHVYIAGQNFNLLKNSSEYDVKLCPTNGGQTITVSPQNFILDAEKNTADLVIDQQLPIGTYQIVFDMKDTAKKDITSDVLTFNVSNDVAYQGGTYGIATIEKDGEDNYVLNVYRDEDEYTDCVINPQETVLLELRGDFSLKYENGKLVEAEAVSLETVDHKAKSTINISNCLDVEKGKVTVSVENPGSDDQVININIDGEVYTTGARTKVWSGVCAISSFENGSKSTLLQYTNEGEPTNDVENSVANTNSIMLVWPGAASTAQTIAGMIMEFRYCQFGQMALEDGEVTSRTPKQRVIAFGAQLSPSFLLPSNYDWSARQTSALETVQLKLAKSNYTADQLRDVQERYAADQAAWEKAESGKLNLYIHDILFGGGFIGFNTSVEIGLPSYADGLPSIEGTLGLKVMNSEYEIGVAGTAEMIAFEMEAELRLRSHNGIPIPDKLYFYAGGLTPGINVDGMGIFWIKGAGGGIDKLYETIYPSSVVPPITLLLSGEFALFEVLSARGDVSISPRDLSIGLTNVNIAGIDLIDYAGVECAWYPELRFVAGIQIGILDIITGSGHLLVEKNKITDKYFWEGYATAAISIPDQIPLVGGKEISSAELGVNAEKIWGAIHILMLDAGVTYYWGGDVDFAFGKYDAPEATVELNDLSVPVYYDEENKRTLYMKFNNDIHVLASSDNIALMDASTASVSSEADKKVHSVNLGAYNNDNGIFSITFDAQSKLIAETYAKGITIVGYPLVWLDDTKAADDAANKNANAMLNWDEETGKASVTISVTDPSNFNKIMKVTTKTASSITLYSMSKLPTLDSVSLNNNTVTWQGTKFDDFSSIAVYAIGGDDEVYPLYKTDKADEIASGSAAISIPENMPSGEYTIRAVGSTKDESSNPMAVAAEKFNYTNSAQPQAPSFTASLGGDYSIDLKGINSSLYDGYKVTVYEVADGKNVPTIFSNNNIGKDDNGQLADIVTVGGQYSQTITKDKNGNIVNPNLLTAEELEQCTSEENTLGLQAGKQYVVGLRGYKTTSDGNEIVSAETLSEPVTMIAPVKANVSLKAQDAVSVDNIDTVKTADVSVALTSDIAVSGEWSLDDGQQTGTISNKVTSQAINISGAADGTHILKFKGENESGDGVLTEYMFTVDTLPPRLQISSPYNGGFYENSVIVKGISDAGANVFIGTGESEPQKVTVGENGVFEQPVSLDSTVAYQNIIVYAEDAVGNQSTPVTLELTNKEIANPNSVLAMYIDGKECDNTTLEAGTQGKLSLKVKNGSKEITINDDSTAANRIDWRVSAIEGEASIDENGNLTTNKKVNGVVVATLDTQSVYAVLGGVESDKTDKRIEVTASAGEANKSYMTIELDTAIEGMTKANFIVKNGDKDVEITEVKASADNKTYTLSGSFDPSVTYTVTVNLTGTTSEKTHIIISAPLLIKPEDSEKIAVKASAGKSKKTYLTINLDTAIEGLTKVNFIVKNGDKDVEITDVKASDDNKTYTLSGSFSTSTTYTVTIDLSGTESAEKYVIANNPISIKPSSGSSGGSGGGSSLTTYKITVTQPQNGKISPDSVNVNSGDSKKFVITPNDGYEIVDVLVNGVSVGKVSEYTFENVKSAAEITAVMKKTENGDTPQTPTKTDWSNPFKDIAEGDWFYKNVKYVNENGLMNGVEEDVFDPNGDVTRAMFVTVLYRMEQEPKTGTATFADVDADSYYSSAVAWAEENNIVNGVSDTEFAPNDNISREQMAAIVYRYAKYKGYDSAVNTKADYTDNDSISEYAKEAVNWLSEKEIMSGNPDGSFAPQANSTRAESAAVFQRVVGNLK